MVVFFAGIFSLLSSISDVRNTYKEAINNSDKADVLVSITEGQKSGALMRAYYGTGLALQAKHSWSPSTKLSKAKSASGELNAAVNASASDLEIRFLRFSFEANLPSFLNLATHLETDKKWLLANKNTNHPMWAVIKNFLKNCELLSETEKKGL
jgi:hypothetical protein